MKTKEVGPYVVTAGGYAQVRMHAFAEIVLPVNVPKRATEEEALAIGVAKAEEMLTEDPARAALARLLASVRKTPSIFISGNPTEFRAAIAETERALGEPDRDWKAEARDDWAERAMGENR